MYIMHERKVCFVAMLLIKGLCYLSTGSSSLPNSTRGSPTTNQLYSISFRILIVRASWHVNNLMLSSSTAGGWAHGYASNSKFYWEDDIYSMVKEFGKYQKDVELRKRGAKQALDDFKNSRIKFVAANFAVKGYYYIVSCHAF